jgi:Bacterial mobilisation protein (MobC)
LNKVGSNLNQMARVLNAGGATITAQECFAALAETRAAVARILEIVGRKEKL